jgi:hypothetical protein
MWRRGHNTVRENGLKLHGCSTLRSQPCLEVFLSDTNDATVMTRRRNVRRRVIGDGRLDLPLLVIDGFVKIGLETARDGHTWIIETPQEQI